MNTCTQTVTLGAYLLGALEPPERYEFESHIAGCDHCRTELIRLAPLPGMLNQISVEDFDEGLPPGELYPTAPMPIQTLTAPAPQMLAPPPELLVPREEPAPEPPGDLPGSQDTVELVPPRRRSLRRVAMAAAVVVAVAFGGVLGWQVLREPPPAGDDGITWTATAPDSGVRADVELIDHERGTELRMKMADVPPGKRCYVVVYDGYGRTEIAGWWGTDHDPNEVIVGNTSFKRSWIDRLEFKLEDKVTIVTVRPPAG